MKDCPNCGGPLTDDRPCPICAAVDRMFEKAQALGMLRRPPKRLVNQQGQEVSAPLDLRLKKLLTGQDAALPPSDRTEHQ